MRGGNWVWLNSQRHNSPRRRKGNFHNPRPKSKKPALEGCAISTPRGRQANALKSPNITECTMLQNNYVFPTNRIQIFVNSWTKTLPTICVLCKCMFIWSALQSDGAISVILHSFGYVACIRINMHTNSPLLARAPSGLHVTSPRWVKVEHLIAYCSNRMSRQ